MAARWGSLQVCKERIHCPGVFILICGVPADMVRISLCQLCPDVPGSPIVAAGASPVSEIELSMVAERGHVFFLLHWESVGNTIQEKTSVRMYVEPSLRVGAGRETEGLTQLVLSRKRNVDDDM